MAHTTTTNDDGMIISIAVESGGVTATVALAEPLHPETNLLRAHPRLFDDSQVAVAQTTIKKSHGTGLSRHGFEPAITCSRQLVPGRANHLVVDMAHEALEHYGLVGLEEFCAEQAVMLLDECVKPRYALAYAA